jgi:hypothetical protein
MIIGMARTVRAQRNSGYKNFIDSKIELYNYESIFINS